MRFAATTVRSPAMGFGANMRSAIMRCGGVGRSPMCWCRVRRAMGCIMVCATTRRCGMGTTWIDSSMGPIIVVMYYYRCAACTSTIRRSTTSTVISSSSTAAEAMSAPTVAIAPTRPWAHAEKDAVIEIAWPVKANGCAGVW